MKIIILTFGKVRRLLNIVLMILFIFCDDSYPQRTPQNKYCRINRDHTMCRFEVNKAGPKCPKDSKVVSLTEGSKAELLRQHNAVRSDVATGEKTLFHCPNAADMLHLEWDTELELIALRWAIQCTPGNDLARNVERFAVGQNVDFYSTKKKTMDVELLDILNKWQDEYENMTEDIFYGKKFENCENFTKIIWGNTKYVGCASHVWKADDEMKRMFVCNYGPRGNILQHRLYTPGAPCSKCPIHNECTTEDDHDGLCSAGMYDSGYTITLEETIIFLGLTAILLT